MKVEERIRAFAAIMAESHAVIEEIKSGCPCRTCDMARRLQALIDFDELPPLDDAPPASKAEA